MRKIEKCPFFNVRTKFFLQEETIQGGILTKETGFITTFLEVCTHLR